MYRELTQRAIFVRVGCGRRCATLITLGNCQFQLVTEMVSGVRFFFQRNSGGVEIAQSLRFFLTSFGTQQMQISEREQMKLASPSFTRVLRCSLCFTLAVSKQQYCVEIAAISTESDWTSDRIQSHL